MRWYRGPDGGQRLWLSQDEIETLMEDELQRAGLLPRPSAPAVDLECLLEKHLRVALDQYADLPTDVLGLTEFFANGRPRVAINRDLTGSAIDEDDSPPGLVGRWRATLAHEAAHVIVHQPLFESPPEQGNLFGEAAGATQRLMRCQKSNVLYRDGGGDWREVQANRGMAALLMPASLFREVVASLRPSLAPLAVASSEARHIIEDLASAFLVSKRAAEIRLGTLGFLRSPAQGALME